MRFYGVLQRIGICYLVVGLFYLWDSRASTKVVALVAALVGYWVLVRWVPIPGVGVPGRDVPFMDMTQNLVSWIDRHLFPASPLSRLRPITTCAIPRACSAICPPSARR